MQETAAEFVRKAATLLRERAEAATPGPWDYNSYNAVSARRAEGTTTDDDWEGQQIEAGHTLMCHGGSPCPIGDCIGYEFGCRLGPEAYDRDRLVCSVPAHAGDTAVRRHKADAELIEAMHPGVALALAGWLAEAGSEWSETRDVDERALAVAVAILGRRWVP